MYDKTIKEMACDVYKNGCPQDAVDDLGEDVYAVFFEHLPDESDWLSARNTRFAAWKMGDMLLYMMKKADGDMDKVPCKIDENGYKTVEPTIACMKRYKWFADKKILKDRLFDEAVLFMLIKDNPDKAIDAAVRAVDIIESSKITHVLKDIIGCDVFNLIKNMKEKDIESLTDKQIKEMINHCYNHHLCADIKDRIAEMAQEDDPDPDCKMRDFSPDAKLALILGSGPCDIMESPNITSSEIMDNAEKTFNDITFDFMADVWYDGGLSRRMMYKPEGADENIEIAYDCLIYDYLSCYQKYKDMIANIEKTFPKRDAAWHTIFWNFTSDVKKGAAVRLENAVTAYPEWSESDLKRLGEVSESLENSHNVMLNLIKHDAFCEDYLISYMNGRGEYDRSARDGYVNDGRWTHWLWDKENIKPLYDYLSDIREDDEISYEEEQNIYFDRKQINGAMHQIRFCLKDKELQTDVFAKLFWSMQNDRSQRGVSVQDTYTVILQYITETPGITFYQRYRLLSVMFDNISCMRYDKNPQSIYGEPIAERYDASGMGYEDWDTFYMMGSFTQKISALNPDEQFDAMMTFLKNMNKPFRAVNRIYREYNIEPYRKITRDEAAKILQDNGINIRGFNKAQISELIRAIDEKIPAEDLCDMADTKKDADVMFNMRETAKEKMKQKKEKITAE